MQILNRETFEISRESEFFSEKELQMQLGHGRPLWPVALLKELIDNSLDACEMANIQPRIRVTVEEGCLGVIDNGPGVSTELIRRSLNYLTRTSDKAYYVSPTRGQLGNALKTVWAAPYVAHGCGTVEVWSQGLHHTIEVSLDRIGQKPVINHATQENGLVKNGTFFKIHWPDSASSENDWDDAPDIEDAAQGLVEGYSLFNPHAHITDDFSVLEPTDPEWTKWKPGDPTAPSWYTPETLRDLIAAYVNAERAGGRARTVREFVSEFRGLSGTAKQKQATGKFSGLYLRDLVVGDDLDMKRIGILLQSMVEHSKEPKPQALGVIGEAHISTWMIRYTGVGKDSIRYARRVGFDGNLPYVLEVAFGIRESGGRKIICGLNWTPTLEPPAYEISQSIGAMRLDASDPVLIAIHIAMPRFDFVDRGKTRMRLGVALKNDLVSAISSVAKEWKKEKRQSDRNDRVSQRALERMSHRPRRVTTKEAAFQIMESAYLHAAGGAKIANGRQVYYAARKYILEATGKSELSSEYFEQTLLKDYMEQFNPDWDVVFDDRGHIEEPHTGKVVGLGGLAVRQYIRGFTNGTIVEKPFFSSEVMIPTVGPGFRYGHVLFIEKEGFTHILKKAKIAERFDVAIASTKGMPVSAFCDLLAELKEHGRKAFVVHDFDKSGFSIAATLRKGARGSKATGEVVDLGLRLEDIEGLEREPVAYNADPTANLRDNGATDEEMQILLQKHHPRFEGERVEINAMDSDKFIKWLEQKLTAHGVKKLVPKAEDLNSGYRRAVFLQKIEKGILKIRTQIEEEAIKVPSGFSGMVQKKLQENPEMSWDEAVWSLALNPK